MPRPKGDLTGTQFGALTAMRLVSRATPGTFWDCLCTCGRHKTVRRTNLVAGRTRSCGFPDHLERLGSDRQRPNAVRATPLPEIAAARIPLHLVAELNSKFA